VAWRKHAERQDARNQVLAHGVVLGQSLTDVSATANEKDPQARDLYLRGRFFWNQRTGSSLVKALDAFTQASIKDPGFVQAYIGLADTYEMMPEFGSMAATDAFPKALSAAQRAVALDPDSPDAHRALAFALFYWEWKTSAAFAQFQRALQLDPDSALTHHWYATALMTVGRFSDAAREIEQARELDPVSQAILADKALIDSYNGTDLERSIAAMRELSQADPSFVSPARYIAWLLFQNKQYERWIEQLQTIAAMSHSDLDREIAQAAERGWRRGGERALLQDVFQVQQRAVANGQVSGVSVATLCLRLGDRESTVRLLQAAYAAHDFRLLIVATFGPMPELQGNAIYEQIRRDVIASMNTPL
jgi:tetratricopeptide (TPR) repeat protein